MGEHQRVYEMTSKTRQILFLILIVSASPTWDNWGSWTRGSNQYPTTDYPTTVPRTYRSNIPRIPRTRASSILNPTHYCDMDFREDNKRSTRDSICNPASDDSINRNYYGFPTFPRLHRYFYADLQALVKRQCGQWCRGYHPEHPDCRFAPGHSLYQTSLRGLTDFMRIAIDSGLHQECSYEGCTFEEVV